MFLVTGSTGFVGSRVMELYPDSLAAPSMRNMPEKEIEKLILESPADTIVHTAAISNTMECEEYPERSYEANVLLPVRIARAAHGKKLVCFSSDQVYNGSIGHGPFREGEEHPVTVYGRHKLEMEQRVLQIAPDAVLLRAEWMYDAVSSKGNYFKLVLEAVNSVSCSSRQFRGVTYVREAAQALKEAVRLPGGVYNFGCEADMSMYSLTKRFVKLLGKELSVLDTAPGPNLWMDTAKAQAGGVRFGTLCEGLLRCAKDHGLL